MNREPPRPLLVPLKRQPSGATPSSSDEQATVELLKQVGDPETLSPEAFTRIGRRLRDRDADKKRRSRLPLFADMRLALLAGGMAAVAIVAALSLSMFEKKPSFAPATEATGEKDELALADKRDAPPTGALGASEPRGEETGVEGKIARQFAAPPPSSASRSLGSQERAGAGFGAVKGGGALQNVIAMDEPRRASHAVKQKKVELAPAPAAAELSAPKLSEPEYQANDDREAAPRMSPSAPVASASGPVPSAGVSADPDPCKRAFPDELVRQNGVAAERALLGRAKCHLSGGLREEGLREARIYLARFPNGQLADEARALLH